MERKGGERPHEQEAKNIRDIFAAFIDEASLGKTIPVIESLDIFPRAARKRDKELVRRGWNYTLLHDLLSNPTYIGLREVNKKHKQLEQEDLKPWEEDQVVRGKWPAIVDEKTFYEVQEILKQNRKIERRRLHAGERRVFSLGVS